MAADMKMIIDVDTGVDDAQAIMMALGQSSRVRVLAVTCVDGNTQIDQVCINTLRVLRACDRLDVPVYRGATGALVAMRVGASIHHGSDGLGDAPDDEAPPDVNSLLQKEHAANALVRMVNENPGEVTLVCLAPLTNIALALKLDPDFGRKLKNVVIMGGTIEVRGNTGPTTEFNFDYDPEAAHIVLRDLGARIQLVPWEPCYRNGIDWDWHAELDSKRDNKKRIFHNRVTAYSMNRKRNVHKYEKFHACDPLAMSVALRPDCVQKSEQTYVTVELRGELTSGQTVIDWRGSLQRPSNVHIVSKVNTDVVKELFEQMLQ